MNCRDFEDLITRYAAGEIPGSSAKELERHLRECPSCRDELTIAETLEGLLRRQVPFPVPAGLRERVMAEIDTMGREEQSLRQRVLALARERQKAVSRADLVSLGAFSVAVFLASMGLASWLPHVPDLFGRPEIYRAWAGWVRPLAFPDGESLLPGLNLLIVLFALLLGFLMVSVNGLASPIKRWASILPVKR